MRIAGSSRTHPGLFLPVGISFYTFKSISYTIDVYRRNITATGNLVHYAVYVSFFHNCSPRPIEQTAPALLPQIAGSRVISWDEIQVGVYHVFWGLFLKVFVADNLAQMVNPVFAKHAARRQDLNISWLVMPSLFRSMETLPGYSYISKGIACIPRF